MAECPMSVLRYRPGAAKKNGKEQRRDHPTLSLFRGAHRLGLPDGDSDAPSSRGKITRSMNFARGSSIIEFTSSKNLRYKILTVKV
jgi:hypothetical protein